MPTGNNRRKSMITIIIIIIIIIIMIIITHIPVFFAPFKNWVCRITIELT